MSSDQPNLPATPGPAPSAPSAPLPVRTAPPISAGSSMRSRLAPATLIVIALVLWAILRPHANPNEQLATRVTVAIVNNDMRPVEKDFNAEARGQLENRARVGRLSQDLNELGKLKAIKEDTQQGAAAGAHHFQAQFEKGTWEEDLTFDADGKIAHFHVHAPPVKLGQ